MCSFCLNEERVGEGRETKGERGGEGKKDERGG